MFYNDLKYKETVSNLCDRVEIKLKVEKLVFK